MEPANKLASIPRPKTPFVGRETELSSLIDALRSGRTTIITGIGGIGKTELLVQALRGLDTGRPVFWIDVELYRSASNIMAALHTALGRDGVACSATDLPARLDSLQACVVFDGIERSTLDDLEEFEDAIAALHSSTSAAQLVATSQVVLYKLAADARFKVGGLDKQSSRQLLESFGTSGSAITDRELGPLLEFCEGHALTLRLVAALVDYYDGPSAAMRAIKTKGVTAVSLPGRKKPTRTNSLTLCLQLAYDAVSDEGHQLLWTLAESPAGLFTCTLERSWLEIPDPIESLAELRRWHLVDLVPFQDDLSRTHVLGPVRAFAIERARSDDRSRYEKVIDRLVREQKMYVAVLEVSYDDPNDAPYVLQRYGHELPNLLHVLDLAQANQANSELVLTAVMIARTLHRYFFVLGLSEQGARVMHDAAELAFSAGHLKSAGALTLQLVSLANRANDAERLNAGLALADRLEHLTDDGALLADIALCRGIAAHTGEDYEAAESYARKAVAGYRGRGRALVDEQSPGSCDDGDARFELADVHGDLSSALGLLGYSLLSLHRFEESAEAYRHSLKHQKGAFAAVNRGQTLHQLGDCESNLGHFREAAGYYLEAAKVFDFVGMEEYLSNALGELGYSLIDLEGKFLPEDLDLEVIERGLQDLARHAKRAFNPDRPLDHKICVSLLRKLFGCLALASLTGKGQLLGSFCVSLGDDVLVVHGGQLSTGSRDKEDALPLVMMDTALRLGVLVAEAEHMCDQDGDISRDTISTLLHTVCETHKWAQHTMRVVDWLALLLTSRWGLQGASPARLREFIENYDDDVVDYLDLSRKGGDE